MTFIVLAFGDIFLCFSPSSPDSMRRMLRSKVTSSVLVFLGSSYPPNIQVKCH